MKKEYKLDEHIQFPSVLTRVVTDRGMLFVGRNEPTWLLVNKQEEKVIEELLKGKTPRETIHELAKNSDVHQTMKNLETTLQKVSLTEFYEKENTESKENIPFHIYITNECNFACKHCYKNASKEKEGEMSEKELKDIVDEISVYGPTKIAFSGGEPLEKVYALSLLEYTKNKGHTVNLVTNGSKINSPEIAEQLAKKTDFLQISLDGPTEETNDALRGEGTFKQIIQGINMFVGIDKLVNIGMTVTNKNIRIIEEKLEELYNNIIQHRPLRFNFSAIANYGRAVTCVEQDIFEKKELTERAMRTAERLGFRRKEWAPTHHKGLSCGYAQGITIGETGNIYFCPVGNKDVQTRYNIRTTTIENLREIFTQEFERTNITNNDNCMECDLTYICGGGCRIENKNHRGSLSDPFCSEEKKNIIYNELAMFAQNKYEANSL